MNSLERLEQESQSDKIKEDVREYNLIFKDWRDLNYIKDYVHLKNIEDDKPTCICFAQGTYDNWAAVVLKWVSDTEVDISDNKQVKKIEEVKDVTNILEINTILCDKYNKRIGIQAKNCKSREKRMQFIAEKMREGSVRYINGEAGINARYNKKLEEYEREERQKKIIT